MAIKVEFSGIHKAYRNKVVLSDFNLTVEENDFIVLIGAPGSGKSVILRILLGLELPDQGKLSLNGENAADLLPGGRSIGYIPQSFALFPHMSVNDNIAYPLTLQKDAVVEIETRVKKISDMLNISDLLEKKPDKLSGGEKQRVAIARGLVKENDIYVLDDPLVGLDFKLREQLQEDLKKLQEDLNSTFIYSTSDCLEALSLADKIAVFCNKKCIETGNPEVIYAEPQNIDSIRMIGFPSVNEFMGEIENKEGKSFINMNGLSIELSLCKTAKIEKDNKAVACIRPEHIKILGIKDTKMICDNTTLILKEDLGGEEIINLNWKGQEIRSVVGHDLSDQIKTKDVSIKIDPQNIRVYSCRTGEFIAKGVRHHE